MRLPAEKFSIGWTLHGIKECVEIKRCPTKSEIYVIELGTFCLLGTSQELHIFLTCQTTLTSLQNLITEAISYFSKAPKTSASSSSLLKFPKTLILTVSWCKSCKYFPPMDGLIDVEYVHLVKNQSNANLFDKKVKKINSKKMTAIRYKCHFSIINICRWIP